MKEITPAELKKLLDNKEDFVLIDVREPYEYDEVNLNGKLIPMGDALDRSEEIPRDKKVVLHCRSGKRSGQACLILDTMGFTNTKNLVGGMLAWEEKFGRQA